MGPVACLVFILLAGTAGSVNASGARFHERQASSTDLSVSDSSTSALGSVTSSSTSTTQLPIATTTTVLTTSIGPNGTSTFTRTVTTLIVSGSTASTTSTTGNGTTTSTTTTAYPSLSTYSSCAIDCFENAVSQAGCSSITDVACYCANDQFASSVYFCAQQQCPDEIDSSDGLAQSFCDVSSPSVSLSFPSSSGSGSSSTTSTSASASASGNSAPALHGRENGASLALGVGILGAALGAILV